MNTPTDVPLKTQIASIWTIAMSTILARLSIFALYHRIFSTLPKFRRIVVISGCFATVAVLVLTLVYTFSCRPVVFLWDKTIPNGKCLNGPNILVAACGVDTATGFWALILPIPVVQRLHTNTKRKMILLGLFTIGAFACITAIIRVPFLLELDNSNDPDWSAVPISIWVAIEINSGIISVCLPTMAPVFRGWLPHLVSSLRYGRSGAKSHSKLADDEARIYAGDKATGSIRTETKVTTSGLGQGRKFLKPDDGEYEVWPMNVTGVKKEVDIEADASLSSKQRMEQIQG